MRGSTEEGGVGGRAMRSVALAALLVLPGGTLHAQTPSDSVRSEAVRALQPGAAVRFALSGTRGSGQVEAAMDGGLVLWPAGGGDPLRLERARLDSLWVRGDAAGAGAAVGTVLGLVPVVASCGQELDECGLVPNGLVVVAVSAGVGYLVGRRIETWRRVLP